MDGMKLVLLGKPMAGKGTQSAILAKKLQLPHISTGEIFREEVKKGTALGKEAKAYLERGDMFPTPKTVEMYKGRLEDPHGFILDGAPRTMEEAQILDKLVSFDLVIEIGISDELIIQRTLQRRLCRGCDAIYGMNFPAKVQGVCNSCGGELYTRSDDTEETIRHRLQVYHDETEPLIAHYTLKGNYAKVDGNGKPEDITAGLLDLIETVK
jgi:adenylate kinase